MLSAGSKRLLHATFAPKLLITISIVKKCYLTQYELVVDIDSASLSKNAHMGSIRSQQILSALVEVKSPASYGAVAERGALIQVSRQ
jgi:hypothetical protein